MNVIIYIGCALSVILFNTSCTMLECKSELVREEMIIDNSQKVIVLELGCGATTQNSYHISIVPKDFLISDAPKGNIFITNHPKFDPHRHVHWNKESEELFITYIDTSDVYKMVSMFEDINIKYLKIE